MSKGTDRTSQFLAAMTKANPEEEEPPPPPPATEAASPTVVHQLPTSTKIRRKAKTVSRADLKHFGGYLDDDTLEKIALLRVRLKKDNSTLMKHAIDEL